MRQGDIITLNTQNKSWREITIQPYHKQKAVIVSLSKTSDLMTVRLLSPNSFKKAHPQPFNRVRVYAQMGRPENKPYGDRMIGDIISMKFSHRDYEIYKGVLIRITEDNPARSYIRGDVLPAYVKTVNERDRDYNTKGVYVLREHVDWKPNKAFIEIE